MAAFGSGGGLKGRRRAADSGRARALKLAGEERTTGRCVVCYAIIGNDTLGGVDVLNHYAQHARGYTDRAKRRA
jgi:hypothetical protein